jgi:hypothetical protein
MGRASMTMADRHANRQAHANRVGQPNPAAAAHLLWPNSCSRSVGKAHAGVCMHKQGESVAARLSGRAEAQSSRNAAAGTPCSCLKEQRPPPSPPRQPTSPGAAHLDVVGAHHLGVHRADLPYGRLVRLVGGAAVCHELLACGAVAQVVLAQRGVDGVDHLDGDEVTVALDLGQLGASGGRGGGSWTVERGWGSSQVASWASPECSRHAHDAAHNGPRWHLRMCWPTQKRLAFEQTLPRPLDPCQASPPFSAGWGAAAQGTARTLGGRSCGSTAGKKQCQSPQTCGGAADVATQVKAPLPKCVWGCRATLLGTAQLTSACRSPRFRPRTPGARAGRNAGCVARLRASGRGRGQAQSAAQGKSV